VWNILLGHRDLEVYVFRLTPNADDGAILARRPVEITPQDDVWRLYQKVMLCGSDLFAEALQALENGGEGQSQSLAEARYYAKRTPADGLIDFAQSETAVFNFIRAQTHPYPGAFSFLDGVCWRIWRAAPFDRFAFRDKSRVPGTVIVALPDGLIVQTAGAAIWLLEADLEGTRVIPGPLPYLESLVGKRFRTPPETHS
jgi:methionyl-tRNA formyltransferase